MQATSSCINTDLPDPDLPTTATLHQELRHYDQFIHLAAFRVGRAGSSRAPGVMKALSQEIQGAQKRQDQPFVESLTFQAHHHKPLQKPQKDNLQHLGHGRFQHQLVAHDAQGGPVGVVQAIFSLVSLLQEVQAKEMSSGPGFTIVPSFSPQETVKNTYAVTLAPLPYTCLLPFKPLSLGAYLFGTWFYHVMTLAVISLILILGASLGVSLGVASTKKRHQQKAHTQACHKKELQTLKRAQVEQEKIHQQVLHQDTLHKAAALKKQQLVEDLQERWGIMATQAYTLQSVVLNLLNTDTLDKTTLQEAHRLAQEASTLLEKLARGHIQTPMDTTFDAEKSLETIQAVFAPQLTAQHTQINITIKADKRNASPGVVFYGDKLVFEVVLYNIFLHLMARFNKHHTLHIDITPCTITFRDNGYVMRPLTPDYREAHNPLRLNKEDLCDFARHVGWFLVWRNDSKGGNSITLNLSPPPMDNAENIIHFPQFKAGAR